MEENKAKRILLGSSSAREKDLISRLSDSLISLILSYLPTKEAVKTSVLSNRWKCLWLLSPELSLGSNEFSDYNAFASFMDRCLDFYREEKSCLHKLKLSVHKDENDNHQSCCVRRWVDFVARAGKLKHLDVECFGKRECLEVMPLSLFICETLLYLRLREVRLGSFDDSSSVSLPLLKTMRLEHNIYADERSPESLILSCPMLEDLSIVRRFDDNVKVLRVCSQTLTSLGINYYHLDQERIFLADDFDGGQFEVLIDAPRLKYLNFKDEISIIKNIGNLGSLTKVNIHARLEGSDDDEVRKFFTSFSRARDMMISALTLLHIKDSVQLPKFCNLSSLEAGFVSYPEKLPMLLGSCPNLKSLILDIVIDYGDREQMRNSLVRLCLLSSLEFVEIKCRSVTNLTMELVRYFAENSLILKKLVLRLRSSTLEENSVTLKDLLSLPRRSSACQIIVC